jgi:hypothetical protein
MESNHDGGVCFLTDTNSVKSARKVPHMVLFCGSVLFDTILDTVLLYSIVEVKSATS